jgi:hypothetical protein
LMFDTDWLAVLVVGLFVAIPVLGVTWFVRRDPAVPTLKRRRRSSDPQAGRSVANGTGVERGDLLAGSVAALPRSPMAKSRPATNFSQAGSSQTPVATAAPRPGVATGLHPKRATVHG